MRCEPTIISPFLLPHLTSYFALFLTSRFPHLLPDLSLPFALSFPTSYLALTHLLQNILPRVPCLTTCLISCLSSYLGLSHILTGRIPNISLSCLIPYLTLPCPLPDILPRPLLGLACLTLSFMTISCSLTLAKNYELDSLPLLSLMNKVRQSWKELLWIPTN